MKKLLLAISAVLFGVSSFVGLKSVNVHAEDEQISCSLTYGTYYLDGEIEVEDTEKSRGDVLLSATEGNVGDEVTALVQCNPGFERDGTTITTFKYLVKDVIFNGEIIQESEAGTGKYVFTLAEGENVFKVVFDGIGKITANDVLSIDWLSLLTVDNLLTFLSWLLSIFLASGFFVTLIKNKKIKNKTVEECVAVVKDILGTEVGEQVRKYVEEKVAPIVNGMSDQYKSIVSSVETMTKCTLLAQEGSAESRKLIADELVKMQPVQQELGEQVKRIVEEAIKAKEEQKEAQKASIEEVKESIKNFDTEEVENNYDGTTI